MASPRTGARQKAYLEFIRWNPGCCAADVVRAVDMTLDTNHAANTYASINALRKRGFIVDCGRTRDGRVHRTLRITQKGLEAIR